MYKEITKANMKLQLKRIDTQVWTKGDILAFAKLINSYRFSSLERRKQIMGLWCKLENRALDTSYSITKEQSQFGIDWLKRICFKKNGQPRYNKNTKDFREYDFYIINNFSHFEFVGFHAENLGYHEHYSPIYRTVDKDGNYFEYVARMWQAPQIVCRGVIKQKVD